MDYTDLKFYRLTGAQKDHIPLYAVRGCRQTLSPLGGEGYRTLSGALVFPTSPLVRKYRSLITCTDLYPVSLENLWPGDVLGVECIQRLVTASVQPGETLLLQRPPVAGSLLLQTEGGDIPLDDASLRDEGLRLPEKGVAGFVSYRPFLHMVLKTFSLQTDEWDRQVGWKMELEEV